MLANDRPDMDEGISRIPVWYFWKSLHSFYYVPKFTNVRERCSCREWSPGCVYVQADCLCWLVHSASQCRQAIVSPHVSVSLYDIWPVSVPRAENCVDVWFILLIIWLISSLFQRHSE